jgi:hypothetical protein
VVTQQKQIKFAREGLGSLHENKTLSIESGRELISPAVESSSLSRSLQHHRMLRSAAEVYADCPSRQAAVSRALLPYVSRAIWK